MARGDVVSFSAAGVPASSRVSYRPATGTEVLITSVSSSQWIGTTPNQTPAVRVGLTDGTRIAWARIENAATLWSGGEMKIFITNSIYITLKNQSNLSADLVCTGIKTK